MRVEQALQLIPPVESLMPLRFALLSTARGDDRVVWEGAGVYRTVGKREIQIADLRRQMGSVLQQRARNRADAFEAYADALDRAESGDGAGTVTHLLKAGRMSEAASLLEEARAWYVVALDHAGALQSRHPEIETLLSLGRVGMRLGRFPESGRHYHRALVLAESERDNAAAADACAGLGNLALEQSVGAAGALAWFGKGLEFAREAGNEGRIGDLHLGLGEASWRTGEWTLAGDNAREAHELFEDLDDARGLARVLSLQAALSAGNGDMKQAAASYREALSCLVQLEPDPALELSIRINYGKILLDSGNYLDTAEELRKAEQLAISNNFIHELVRIYTLMGTTHGRQGDEVGFVFFEQAIELMRMLDHSPLEEAQVCFEYGVFENRVERPEESRAYLERAKRIFESIGSSGGLQRVEAELNRVSA